MQAQAAIGAEHHDGFAQVVERRLLHVDQAVEFRLQREFVGDVLEQQQHAAERVALARNAQDAAVGQVPEILDDVDLLALIVFQLLPSPFGEVGARLQFTTLAQAVEDGAVIRPVEQVGGIKLPHFLEGAVVEDQLAIGPEDGDAVGDVVQRVVVSLGVLLQRLARGFLFGDVEGHAAEAAGQGEHLHAHGAALARDNDVPHLVGFAVGVDGLLRLASDVLVEHDLAVEHMVHAGRADGLHVGAVDPLQLAGAGHPPGREGRLAEHFEEGHGIACDGGAGFLEAGAGAGFFKALDGGVGDPEHCPRAGGAAISFKEAA